MIRTRGRIAAIEVEARRAVAGVACDWFLARRVSMRDEAHLQRRLTNSGRKRGRYLKNLLNGLTASNDF
jgi:hypothetical protein